MGGTRSDVTWGLWKYLATRDVLTMDSWWSMEVKVPAPFGFAQGQALSLQKPQRLKDRAFPSCSRPGQPHHQTGRLFRSSCEILRLAKIPAGLRRSKAQQEGGYTVTVDIVYSNATQTHVDATVTSVAQPNIQVGGGGLGSVTVTSVVAKPILLNAKPPTPCQTDPWVKTLPAVALTALPLYADAVECQLGIDGIYADPQVFHFGPFFFRQLPPCNPQDNNEVSPACTALQNAIQSLRNDVLKQCPIAANLKSKVINELAVAGGLFAAAVALAIAAAGAPWPANLVLALIAGIALVIAVAAGILAATDQKSLDNLIDLMTDERSKIQVLVARLSDVCCPEQIKVMEDEPSCNM